MKCKECPEIRDEYSRLNPFRDEGFYYCLKHSREIFNPDKEPCEYGKRLENLK